MKCNHDFKDCVEEFDCFFDDEILFTTAYCNGCGGRVKKTYKLDSTDSEVRE